ncbi:arylsulfatase A-like enzyme [Dyadobacter jejuensis]|uniref:Arylsulfatase A-like enzyme n=1 Tax=Dyadobacter jejuensis TaxID=1082580 RepID=A0A316AKV6_9BACT|nr:arylsulfatase [Dyadobacter jejuensis]PWJ57879.1 arylsulfatase A-like enzyme [Dyadobacter jejuensis]
MKSKNFLLAVCLFSMQLTAFAQNNKAPNIIYILADDLGIGDVSAFNAQSKLNTVHIDKLSQDGMIFTDAHTSSAVCTPTRYSILTGRYNWRTHLKNGVLSGFSKSLITPERTTVAKVLHDKGYTTAFVGKWHLGWDWALKPFKKNLDDLNAHPEVDYSQALTSGPNDIGFDYSYGFSGSLDMAPYVYVENGKATALPTDTTISVEDKGFWRKGVTSPDFVHAEVLQHVTDKSIAFINKNASNEKPFFLYFALPAPHTPILPTTEFLGKSNTNFYGDFVLQVDDVVGQIEAVLKEKGISDNTLIIFTSDNGCSPKANFNELARVSHDPSYIYRGHKADIYEGGHRVPFVVKWPKQVPAGTKSTQTICTTDFFATAAEITGYKMDDTMGEDSYSFLNILKDPKNAKASREATVHHSIDGRFAIRKDQWKLVLWPGSGGWTSPKSAKELDGLPPYQLFDLDKDPAEENNLYASNPAKVKELEALMKKYINEGRSTPGKIQKNDEVKEWKQLEWMTKTGR